MPISQRNLYYKNLRSDEETKRGDDSQHNLFMLNFGVIDVNVGAFFHQVLGHSDACRLPTVTTNMLLIALYSRHVISANCSSTTYDTLKSKRKTEASRKCNTADNTPI